jgi:steroid delta-isomerase
MFFNNKEEKMDANLEEKMLKYKKYWDELTDESVEGLRELASPNVRYRDPFMDAKGIDAVVAYHHKWFANLDDNKFEIKEYAVNGLVVYSYWRQTFRLKKLPKKSWELYGMSKTIYNEAGKIEDHIDYYDSSPILEYLPVLGKVVTLIRKIYTG